MGVCIFVVVSELAHEYIVASSESMCCIKFEFSEKRITLFFIMFN